MKAAMGYGYKEYHSFYINEAFDTLMPDTVIKGNLPLYTQPLVILIGTTTCSASEDLLLALKLHHPNRALLIGTPTSGSTGAPLVRNFPEFGLYYRICVRKPITPLGLFENGIQPDIYFEPSIDELVKGLDPIIEVAKKELEQILKKSK